MGLAAIIIAFVSAIAASASAIMAWTSRADSLRAQEEAQKSADKAAGAHQQMAAMQSSVFHSPPWTFEWWTGDTFLLTNTSSVDAYEVTVSSSPEGEGIRVGLKTTPAKIGARSAVKVMYAPTMASPWVTNIVVTWAREPSGEQLEWIYPFPSRPK